MSCEPIEVREKDWGGVEEYLFSGPYLVKRLTLAPGAKTPMHWHYAKTETLYLVSGALVVEYDGPVGRPDDAMDPGDWVTIREGRKNAHRMCAGPDGAVYIECSTPHHDDSARVQ